MKSFEITKIENRYFVKTYEIPASNKKEAKRIVEQLFAQEKSNDVRDWIWYNSKTIVWENKLMKEVDSD